MCIIDASARRQPGISGAMKRLALTRAITEVFLTLKNQMRAEKSSTAMQRVL